MSVFERQGENGDGIEVVSDFTHYLPEPRMTVVAIAAEELGEGDHLAGMAPDELVQSLPKTGNLTVTQILSRTPDGATP